MRRPIEDVTAGTRAREIHEHPETPQPISDPMDPQYGHVRIPGPGRGRVEPLRDPTNPRYGDPTV
jgi:hypothetical protein